MRLQRARDVCDHVGEHGELEGQHLLRRFGKVRRGDIAVKPAIARLSGDRVRFVDGSEAPVDHIVYATGYEVALPFLSPSLIAVNGRELPLYRRIAATEVGGLYFAGFIDAPGRLLPVVETQGRWIATAAPKAATLRPRPSPPRTASWSSCRER